MLKPAEQTPLSRSASGNSSRNLDHAIGGVADAIFCKQGQGCTAGSRLFAHKSVYDTED